MIIKYKNGLEMINDNYDLLNKNQYLSSLIILDGPLIKDFDKNNYCFKVVNNTNELLFVNAQPYCLQIIGDKILVKEGFSFIQTNKLSYNGLLSERMLGDHAQSYLNSINIPLYLHLGMDFMQADKLIDIDTSIVSKANLTDSNEIYELCLDFIKDAGVIDYPNIDNIKRQIDNYRIIKKDNKIISMAKINNNDETSDRISWVFTRREYRGKGYGKICVSSCLNEIVNNNKKAVLNVDIKNPISNKLYKDIGFVKLFSQGEYRIK